MVSAIEFEFDYQYDVEGFFEDPTRRNALETAGSVVNRYVDRLAAIAPGGNNQWNAFLTKPNGERVLVVNESIPADTIKIYVGSDRRSGPLAWAIPSPGTPAGTPEFRDTVVGRGEANTVGATPTDYGPWGGSITFNSNIERAPWFFGEDIRQIDDDQYDFLTIAMHEIGHLLGVGVAPSFFHRVSATGHFVGSEATAVLEEIELDLAGHHVAGQTRGDWNGTSQPALFAASFQPGTRRYPTDLDRAILRDIGWQEAVAGDADLNGKFDIADFGSMDPTAYENGQLASWSDGDFNGDALFTSDDFVVAFADDPTAAVPSVTLFYDPFTGQVDVESARPLSLVQMESTLGQLSSVTLGGPYDLSRADKLFIMSDDGFENLSFARVLPAGLSAISFENDIQFTSVSAEGQTATGFDLVVVPESTLPASAAVFVVLLAARLRRRSVTPDLRCPMM